MEILKKKITGNIRPDGFFICYIADYGLRIQKIHYNIRLLGIKIKSSETKEKEKKKKEKISLRAITEE